MVTMNTPLKNQWWRDQVWDGCLINPDLMNLKKLSARPLFQGNDTAPVGWFNYAIPTINQHGPSCCGQAWANWLEMMLRRYVGIGCLAKGEQIDGYAIWKRAREMFYNGNLAGGLYLHQGFAAMVDLGLIPSDAELVSVEPDVGSISEQLTRTPMVQGSIVSEGWYETNPENGCIDHTKPPKPGDGGHATCIMGMVVKTNAMYLVSQNSWGSDYGWKGYFLMSERFWNLSYIGQGPCTIKMPIGWVRHDGWKKYVTKDPQ